MICRSISKFLKILNQISQYDIAFDVRLLLVVVVVVNVVVDVVVVCQLCSSGGSSCNAFRCYEGCFQ